mmetsp:Transcript_2145/g.3433  ORF Transcript_2145/g.3433 Transcript_2145/m.3433 type:complete len:185 (+) Transcript_2145:135-689(+)
MVLDVEASETGVRQRNVTSSANEASSNPQSTDAVSDHMNTFRPIRQLKTLSIFLAAIYGLHEWHVLGKILYGAKVKHDWFKFGLAASVALLAIKAYVEMYQGKVKKKRVEYKNFRHETHAILGLFTFAGIAFHVALWPEFGYKTILVMMMFGYGVLLQIMLLIPTWAQNLLSSILITWFIQEYV